MNTLGIVKSIFICPMAGEPMVNVPKVIALQEKGLEGDRYSNKTGFWQKTKNPRPIIRDVSIINFNDIANSPFTEAETRRNIIVDTQIKLTELIGKKFYIGKILFLGTEDCTPCSRPSKLSGKADFEKIFKERGGLRAQVLTTGEISVGDYLLDASL